jgi:lipoprotein signal peptidase
MSDSSLIMTLLGQAVFLLPTIVICIIGITMIQKRLPVGKARKAGVLGFTLLLVGAIANLLFYALINRFLSSQDYSGHEHMQLVSTVYRLFSVLLHSGGLVLLIMAICGKDGPSDKQLPSDNPYGQ